MTHPGSTQPPMSSGPMGGQYIGRYRAVSYLGSGGMADVFKCELSGIGGFGKMVVVKRMKPELVENGEFVAMFLDEARLVARLNHPNIVQVFEIDIAGGVPFIAMELVRGPTLSRLIRHARQKNDVRYDLLVRVIADAALGLASAHAAADDSGKPLGLVHRDVSPQNIITGAEGGTKLLDFGVAKAEGKIARTATGMLKGKIAYMSPEQVASQEVDARADVFSIAVCLYQAVTGRLPFAGANEVEVLRARLKGEWIPAREANPDVPEALDAIITAGLAQDPNERTPSAMAFHEQLESYLSNSPNNTDRRAVAQWISELFPDVDSLVAGAPVDLAAATSLPPVSSGTPINLRLDGRTPMGTPIPAGLTPTSQANTPSSRISTMLSKADGSLDNVQVLVDEVQEQKKQRSPLFAAGLVVLGVAVVAAFVLTRESPPPAVDTASVVRTLLEDAEQRASTEPSVALELLARVRATGGVEAAQPEVALRINKIEVNARVSLGREALAVDDKPSAIRHLRRALDLDVRNAEARELLVKAEAGATKEDDDEALADLDAIERAAVVDVKPVPKRPAPPPRKNNRRANNRVRDEPDEPAEADEPVEVAMVTPPPPVEPQPAPVPAPVETRERPAPNPLPTQPQPRVARIEEDKVPAEAPDLGARSRILVLGELISTCKRIESQLRSKGHLPPSAVDNVTALLAKELAGKVNTGNAVELYPSGVYWFVVAQTEKGKSKTAIARELVAAHNAGRLQGYSR